jgi:Flp pilus assembly protein TadD
MLHSARFVPAVDRRLDGRRVLGGLAGRIAWVCLAPLLTACAGPSPSLLSAIPNADTGQAQRADAAVESQPVAAAPDLLTQARNLRRAGDRKKAFDLIENAVAKGPSPDRGLLVEGGLLALELGAPDKADVLLRKAEDPAKPDWRVLSGLGVAASAQSRHVEAVHYFKAALVQSPGQASVLNNLALAHVLARKPGEAEGVLRAASKAAPTSARIKQNLALTQGLKGRGEDSGESLVPDKTPTPAASPAPRKAAAAAPPPQMKTSWSATLTTPEALSLVAAAAPPPVTAGPSTRLDAAHPAEPPTRERLAQSSPVDHIPAGN